MRAIRDEITEEQRQHIERHLIVLAGPSGAGKSTLRRKLCASIGARLVVGCTTRRPREGEVDGVDYWFSSRRNFDGLAASGLLIESESFGGNLYGLTWIEIARVLGSDATSVLITTISGYRAMCEVLGCKPWLLWLDAPDDVLRARMIARGDAPGSVARRLALGEQMRAELGDELCFRARADEPLDELIMCAEAIAETARERVRVW